MVTDGEIFKNLQSGPPTRCAIRGILGILPPAFFSKRMKVPFLQCTLCIKKGVFFRFDLTPCPRKCLAAPKSECSIRRLQFGANEYMLYKKHKAEIRPKLRNI